ncbi:MAG TPA: hypothetical protein PLN52_20770 [Opitutaceae bacterium]|nr:hypothetical protein [Opitutaceae bacterium]
MKLSTFLLTALLVTLPLYAREIIPMAGDTSEMVEPPTHSPDHRPSQGTSSAPRDGSSEGAEKSESAEEKSKTTSRPLPSRAHLWLT